jgi:hypothetical protein
MSAFASYITVSRARLSSAGKNHVRAVYASQIIRAPEDDEPLEDWMFGKVPLFYRAPEDIAESFKHTTDFTKPIRDTLLRLPSKQSFQESHFGEILAGVFCEEVLGLRLLYSKLSLLTAEDTNAHKMDLVLYRLLQSAAVEFTFAEVKSSMKQGPEDASHDRGCFAKLFDSLREYQDADRDFDLAVIEDRMKELPADHRERVRRALSPDTDLDLRYAGVCVIDSSTHDDAPAQVLGTRASPRTFDVDVLAVAELPAVATATYARLEQLRVSVQRS